MSTHVSSGARRTVTFERTFDASIEEVWDLWAASSRKAGMPLTTKTRARYTEVDAPRRLSYSTSTDFIPDITPYEAATVVELYPIASGVKMVLTIDAMR